MPPLFDFTNMSPIDVLYYLSTHHDYTCTCVICQLTMSPRRPAEWVEVANSPEAH